jgi:hypothetical protein
MRKVLALLIILAWPLSAWAGVTYYVSNANPMGSDSNNGTSPSTPWLTIAKVNSSNFQPGDSILFNCGCTWREGLVVPSSGTSSNPITFGSHGTGAQPKIYGSAQLTGWTNENGNLWYASQPSAPAEVWFVTTGGPTIWGIPGSTKGNLTAEYDWWYDSRNLRVYIYSPTSPASQYASVESGVQTYAVNNNSQNYITVQNLEMAYSNEYGVWVGYTTGWSVVNNTVHHIGPQGGGSSLTAEGISLKAGSQYVGGNVIYETGRHGISIEVDNGHTLAACTIEHNTVSNAYHDNIDIQNLSGTLTSVIVRYNYVYNSSSFNNANWYCGGVWALGSEGHAVSGIHIYYNVFYNLTETAIVIRDLVPSPAIYNNTIYGHLNHGSDNWAAGIDVFSKGTYYPSGVIIENNICQDTYSPCLHNDNTSEIATCDYNDWYMTSGSNVTEITGTYYSSQAVYRSATGWDSHGIWQDPIFVSTSTPDLRLQLNSPAIRAGVKVGISTDYTGNAVPSVPDMGAYEYPVSPPTGLRILSNE